MSAHKLRPESLMMSHGYKPELSQGAIKAPVFQTSTFVFQTAEEGKAFFELAYGLREKDEDEEQGLIYSRINNPNLQILEERLCLWDEADQCAVFESGMSAISTVMLEFLKPGDVVLFSSPTYGGTDHFIHHFLPSIGVSAIGFTADSSEREIMDLVIDSGMSDRIKMIYVETPANPTNALIDIDMCRRVADNFSTKEAKVRLAVDNTYMGPLWCNPLKHGADLVIYSATKYIGGHSDVIAGAVLGSNEVMGRIKVLRTFLGNMASPNTCWLLLRSLETLQIRMQRQMENAKQVAACLRDHALVKCVSYLGHLAQDSPQRKIYERQYKSPGAMISVYIDGGEREAFVFLNHLRLFKLAVSLGGTESLAQHPATMTHAGVSPEEKENLGVTSSLVRLSIGVENVNDLIWDVNQALEAVRTLINSQQKHV